MLVSKHGACIHRPADAGLHGLSPNVTLKFKALRRFLLIGPKAKLLALGINGRRQFSVLFFRAEICLDNVERLLVDFHVFV